MIEKVTTADGTETFLNTEVGESYHSFTGAVDEAYKKYVVPTKIKEKAKLGSLRILDVCFGLGYNSAMAISVALEVNPNCKIEVVGLEVDGNIIDNIRNVNPPIPFYQHYRKLTRQTPSFIEGTVSVNVIIGDARKTATTLPENHFDAIFFDPFSPKTTPEMWDASILEAMFNVLKEDGIFATYSCARVVRDNLMKVGFLYDDGPIVGRRGPGTIATKNFV